MPARKSDIKIIIEAGGNRFSLNCEKMINNKYRVKTGRSKSKKMPVATLTEIFETARRWAVKNQTEK